MMHSPNYPVCNATCLPEQSFGLFWRLEDDWMLRIKGGGQPVNPGLWHVCVRKFVVGHPVC